MSPQYPRMMSSKTPEQSANFQRSLDVDRMRQSRRAAAFARAAPLPRQSAYGSNAAAQAGRSAFLEDMDVAAESAASQVYGGAGNHFLGRDLMRQDMGNLTTMANAQAGYLGARGRNLDAMNQLYPAQAGLMGAQAQNLNAMAPVHGAQANLLNAQAGDLGARAPIYPAQAGLLKAQGEALNRPLPTFDPRQLGSAYLQGMQQGVRQGAPARPDGVQTRFDQSNRDFAAKSQIRALAQRLADEEDPGEQAAIRQQIDQLQQRLGSAGGTSSDPFYPMLEDAFIRGE